MDTQHSKKILRLIAVFLTLTVAGCANWQRHGVVIRPPEKIALAVVPVRSIVHITKRKQIETRPRGEKLAPDEAALAEEQMRAITAQMTTTLTERLHASHHYAVVAPNVTTEALAELGNPGISGPLTAAQARALGTRLHVPLVLTVRLDGYGKIRPEWMLVLLGSAAVEAATQGIVAAEVTGNVCVAAGLAAEESAQELAEWVIGPLVFNKFFRPVILEATLRSTQDGHMVWHKTLIATAPKKQLKHLSTADRKKREVRLHLSYDHAETRLVQSLEKAAAHHVRVEQRERVE